MKSKVTSLILVVCLMAALAPMQACMFGKKQIRVDPAAAPQPVSDSPAEAIINQVERGVIYSNTAIAALDELHANGLFAGSPQAVEVFNTARSILVEVRDGGEPIIELARTLTTLEADREKVRRAFDKVFNTLKRLKPQIERVVEFAIGELNRRGVSSIDLATVPTKVNLAYVIIETAFRVAKTRIK